MPIPFDAYLVESVGLLLVDEKVDILIDRLGEVTVPTIADVWETLQRLLADLPQAAQATMVGAYPGYANVILGAITEFAVPIELTADMDGVLITIEDVGGQLGKRYLPTAQPVIQHAGFLTFGDGGDWEDIQALAISSRAYTPRVFQNPSSVCIVPTPGVHGTVQPWRKNNV